MSIAGRATSLVISSRHSLTFGLVSLQMPDRLILTLHGIGRRGRLAAFLAKHPLDPGLVRRYRVDSPAPGEVRLRLWLTRALSPNIFSVESPDHLRRCLVLQLIWPSPDAADAMCPPSAPLPLSAAGEGSQEAWFDVSLNRERMGTVLLLEDASGHFWIADSDLERWRLTATGPATMFHGTSYHRVDELPGAQVKVDPQAMRLAIHAAAAAFRPATIAVQRAPYRAPTRPPYGMFLAYDLSGESHSGRSDGGGLFSVDGFGPGGRVTSDFASQYVDGRMRTVRLDSAFVRDNPASMTTLRVGDSITAPGMWGRSVRFGGIQWGTNFATRPDAITFPLQDVVGEATLPSTVDLYVNRALVMSRDISPGPFTLSNIPVVNGTGDIRMVVRDVLGREHIIEQPFYADVGLLRAGLWSQSYALGAERQNWSLASNDYGSALFTTTQRVGLSNAFTGELHAEVLRGQQTGGLGGAWLVGPIGTISAAAAYSHSAGGRGQLLALGVDHQGRLLSIGLRAQLASRAFVQLGMDPERGVASIDESGYISLAMPFKGSLALNFSRRAYRDADSLDVMGLGYSQSLGPWGYLHASVLEFAGSEDSWMAAVGFMLPLGARSSASLDAQEQQGGRLQTDAVLQRNVPAGRGFGYRLQADAGGAAGGEADFTANGEDATYSLGLADQAHSEAVRAGIRGSVAMLGGGLYPSRTIQDSAALVRVPGFADVRVYEDNHLVAVTDHKGDALVPGLLPYQANSLRIDQADLPMTADVGATEVQAVPYAGSGMTVTFPVHRDHPMTLTLIRASGAEVPPGSSVTLSGRPGSYPVGFNGLLYVPDASLPAVLTARWPGGACTVRLGADAKAKDSSMPTKVECR